jgi:uncharacterized protein with NRDE domain
MCILFFAINQHPAYPVIICANRDEFHQRPTKAMHWWQPQSSSEKILAGKDLQAGGTWLGLSESGIFSALTNFRQPALFDKNKKTRGKLVLQAIETINNNNQNNFEEQLATTTEQYNGYNLVFGKLDQLSCFDNVSKKTQLLTDGVHSLCNGALDDIWPKMALGQTALLSIIKENNAIDVEALFSLMKNAQQAQTKDLPNTGVSKEWEHFLSAIFIKSEEYGTRTTNIITLTKTGAITIYDRSYNIEGNCIDKSTFTLTL